MPVENRTTLKTYFETNDVPSQAQFTNLIDSAANLGEANDFQGNSIRGVTGVTIENVSGLLSAATHSGTTIVTSGNVTIPTVTGFYVTIEAGGAHTVTFNGATSAPMAAGDVMSVTVRSPTVIKASLLPVASQVVFS